MADSIKTGRRVAGVTVPLFSLRSARSWGVGEISDLAPFAQWMSESAGIKLVQILPLGEIAGTETSPYSALSAFGIDWLYIDLSLVPDLDVRPHALRDALGSDMGVAILRKARESARVDYESVRFVKARALQRAFLRFEREHLANGSDRAKSFENWSADERHWLEDYALFRALKDARNGEPWWKWERPLREREPWALDGARQEFSRQVAYYKYLQWLAHGQWERVRAKLREDGLEVMGDLPFMVGRDSADVWGNQREFRHDRNVGAPGDQFDPEGQDWGLPPYKWEAMRANDFAWLRRRARYAGSLYDRFRIDHLIGFYRTYTRPLDPRDARGRLVEGAFDPAEPRAQLAHGERVVGAMKNAGLERSSTLIAEDLGVIPDWVRASLERMDVPGYKVLIWEKNADGSFKNPADYPRRSVSALGTHDTDSCVTWWETRDDRERAEFAKLPTAREKASALTAQWSPTVHRALLDAILSAGSELSLLLMQDVLAVRDRVNTPGTVGPQNWTWRLPGTIETLRSTAHFAASLARVREAIRGSGRDNG